MTSLVRVRDLSGVRSLFDGFFTDPIFRDVRALGRREPHVDVEHSDTELLLKIGLAGVDPKDVDLAVENGLLRISTASQGEDDNGATSWYSSWEQSFTLPRGVDPENVKAEFDNGLLKVRIPKVASTTSVHHVAIAGVDKETSSLESTPPAPKATQPAK